MATSPQKTYVHIKIFDKNRKTPSSTHTIIVRADIRSKAVTLAMLRFAKGRGFHYAATCRQRVPVTRKTGTLHTHYYNGRCTGELPLFVHDEMAQY